MEYGFDRGIIKGGGGYSSSTGVNTEYGFEI